MRSSTRRGHGPVKRVLLAFFGLVTACGSGTAQVSGETDASNDARPPAVDAATVVAPDASVSDAGDAGSDPCAEAGIPASTLACTGLYANFATKEIAAGALAYTPSTPLWSDGAQKQRWIELPPGTQIDISHPSEWTFPVGTKLFKEFRVAGKRVETRLFQKVTSASWDFATYAWNSDDSAATINFGGAVPVPGGDGGTTWNIPTNDDCDECHRGRQDRILGFEQVSLGLPGAQGLTLAQLAEMELVTPAPASVSLTVGDDGTGLDALALGWIHVNCGVTCHNSNPSAAGYGAGMLLRLDPDAARRKPAERGHVGHPEHDDQRPVRLGKPRGTAADTAGRRRWHSAIHQLIDQRGALQMPPIASLVVDTADVAVVASWIAALGSDGGAPSFADGGVPLRDGGALDAGGHRGSDGGEPGAASPDSGSSDASADAGDGGHGGPGSGEVDAEDEGEDAGDAQQ